MKTTACIKINKQYTRAKSHTAVPIKILYYNCLNHMIIAISAASVMRTSDRKKQTRKNATTQQRPATLLQNVTTLCVISFT
jgi:hypothetical protein